MFNNDWFDVYMFWVMFIIYVWYVYNYGFIVYVYYFIDDIMFMFVDDYI